MKKRKDGRYQKGVVIDGVKRVIYGKTQAEITRKIREWKEKTEAGLLYKDVAEDWWQIHEPTIEHNTMKSYLPAWKRTIEWFKDKRINDITPSDVNSCILDFALSGYAYKTVRTQLMMFNMIFKYAVIKGYIPSNPAREVQIPKNLPKKKVEMPSDEELNIVKQSYDKTFGDFAYWVMYTGLRRCELLALTWEDIDEEKREINVNKSIEYVVNKQPRVKKPKTEKGIRIVPILDKLHEKIVYKKHGLVFPNAKGEYMRDHEYERLWSLYQRETNTTFTAHMLRHGFTTMLIESGTPIEVVQYILGHAQISTTMDIYAQLRDKRRKDVFKKIQNIDIY